MQVFLDWFNASGGSYTKKIVKMFQFWWFFEIFADKKLSDFYNFCFSYFIYCNEALCKFLQKTDSIYCPKSSETPILGLFQGDINFLELWPIKLSLFMSKTTLNRLNGQK